MTSLTRYENEGLEFYINVEGAVFATQAGIARMCDTARSTVQSWISRRKHEVFKAEIATTQGSGGSRKIVHQSVLLFDEDVISQALAHFNPERLRQWAMLGIRATAQKLVGWKSQEPISTDLRPGSVADRYFDRGNPEHMNIYSETIHKRIVDEDLTGELHFTHKPDNGRGYSVIEVASQYTAERIYTIYASSDDVASRRELREFVNDQMVFADLAGEPCSVVMFNAIGTNQINLPKLAPKLQPIDKHQKLLSSATSSFKILSSI